MLREIYISNFILIDELRLEFVEGLNVLTGETGTGKSIIIDALGLIMGERVKSDYIRDTSRRAVAEAVFDISGNEGARVFLLQNGLIGEEEDTVVISREINSNGRSSVRVNGRNVTIFCLKSLAAYLVDMHLQHEHLSVLRPDMYLTYVDSFTPESRSLLPEVKKLFAEIKDKEQQLEELRDDEQNKLQKLDFLSYQIKEIEAAKLQLDEEEQLKALKRRITNTQNLLECSGKILQLLYNGEHCAYDMVSEAVEAVVVLKDDEFFASLLNPLEEMLYGLQDIAASVSSFRDSLDFEPGVLDEVENRLYEIERLKRKYGNSISEILAFGEKAKKEVETLESSHERIKILEEELRVLHEKYLGFVSRLTQFRKKAAAVLEDKVSSELSQLDMPHIKFAVLIKNKKNPGPSGMDEIEFLFSPNPGEELRPLSRIASGGEISRFVLALKKALAEVYDVPTLIFDEVDVGVGGTALTAMAKKLSELSHTHQVILVTHSPQIASYSDNHYLIEKNVFNDKVTISTQKLDQEKKVKEIARMLDGENYSSITLEHARELLNNTRK